MFPLVAANSVAPIATRRPMLDYASAVPICSACCLARELMFDTAPAACPAPAAMAPAACPAPDATTRAAGAIV